MPVSLVLTEKKYLWGYSSVTFLPLPPPLPMGGEVAGFCTFPPLLLLPPPPPTRPPPPTNKQTNFN